MSTNGSSPFSSLIGNPQAKKLLERLVHHQMVPGTLLFYGQKGVGKTAFAFALAKALMGNEHAAKIDKKVHPDLHIQEPEGKMGLHAIEALRSLIDQMALPPYEAPVKIFIIKDAHRMLPTGANALLKTLEEPSLNSYIILTTDQPDTLLPTIPSRCRRIPFFPIPEKEIADYLSKHTMAKNAGMIAQRAQGSLQRALELSQGEELSPPELLAILKSGFSYPVVAEGLEKLDAILSDEELAIDQKNQIVESWLEHIVWWHRDGLLLRSEGARQSAFYEEEIAHHAKLRAALPLPALMDRIAECRRAIQHNVKPSVALEVLFLDCEY